MVRFSRDQPDRGQPDRGQLDRGQLDRDPFAGWHRRAIAQTPEPPDAFGPAGINIRILHQPPYNLSGRKIAIGQVEPGRPVQFGYDKRVDRAQQGVVLAGVFFRDQLVRWNTNGDTHAYNVASVMVGAGKAMQGVAPQARLFSAAVGNLRRNGQAEECLAMQHLALQNGGDVRAINLSFGESLHQDSRPNARLDGNALLTQCLDWSARVHDLVYAVAGNQGKGGIPIPTDQFNGITVAYSRDRDGRFSKLDFANLGNEFASVAEEFEGKERNLQGRGSVGLVAPGANLTVLNPDGNAAQVSGTSFASPQVVGVVALLQEYGDRLLNAVKTKTNRPQDPPWSLDARRHEVMKAVLFNSADKVRDRGDGNFLGMTQPLVTQNNQDWLSAPRNPTIPLHPLLGAGQLNGFRAYQQFSAGQGRPTNPVAPLGWDYGQVGLGERGTQNRPAYQDYTLSKPLKTGSYVAITLAWDRRVELVDANANQTYDLGESFRDRGLNNLDLYLMRAHDTDARQAVARSISSVDSVEHVFAPIPQAGQYKIRVQFHRKVNEPTQAYGLAWWTVPQP